MNRFIKCRKGTAYKAFIALENLQFENCFAIRSIDMLTGLCDIYVLSNNSRHISWIEGKLYSAVIDSVSTHGPEVSEFPSDHYIIDSSIIE